MPRSPASLSSPTPTACAARRHVLLGLAAAALAPTRARAETPPAPNVVRPPELRWTTAIPLTHFAPANASRPSSTAIQAALDEAFATGLPIIMGRGEWLLDRTLVVRNPDMRRRKPPSLLGATDTRLRGGDFDGPLLQFRGAPLEPPAHDRFLSGGIIEGVTFLGYHRRRQNGLDVLGWINGRIANCTFQGFTGDGVRVHGDKALDPNPDWTASTVAVEGTRFIRNGGWGFHDDNPIGAPGWSFERCVFSFNGRGGAMVHSSGMRFLACSISENGYLDETTPSEGPTAGIWVSRARGSTVNRLRIEIAEFDSNRAAHLVLDRVTSFLVEDARFIQRNRAGIGRLPPVCVVLGSEPQSLVYNGRVTRPLFRHETTEEIIGFDARTDNLRDLAIERGHSSDETGKGKFTPFNGFGTAEAQAKRRIVTGA